MSKKRTVVVLLGIGLGAAAWLYSQPELVKRWWAPTAAALQQLGVGAQGGAATSTAAPRKCKTATAVIYTDGACPAGSREMALEGGTVTVVPAQAPPAAAAAEAPAAPASARSLLKELSGPQDSAAIKAKMIEQAMQR
jgi:hypothetical protein